MGVAYEVGILISRHIFRDCLKACSPYESFALYDDYGQKEGFHPVFFTLDDISYSDLTVHGYVRNADGGFERKRLPLPCLIHNRIKPMLRDSPELSRLRRLEETTLFNTDNRLDKWTVYRILAREPALSSYLPETKKASYDALTNLFSRHSILYLKPSDKSLAMGIYRLNREGDGKRVQVSSPYKRKVKWVPVDRSLHQLIGKQSRQNYLLQQGVDLIRLQEGPVDIRVSVQRGKSGTWEVSGIVARVGPSGGVATNVAVGGRARMLKPLLQELGMADSEKILHEIERVSVKTAEVLSGYSQGLADLGLDVGLDTAGRVWIIEVNGRDLRITFRQAEDWRSWELTFGRPMEYAAFLLRNRETVGPRIAFLTPGTLPLSGRESGSVETAVRETSSRLGKSNLVYVIGKGVGSLPSIRSIEIPTNDRKGYWNLAMGHLRRLCPDIIHVENRPAVVERVRKVCPDAKLLLYAHSDRFFQPPSIRTEELEKTFQLCDAVLTNSVFLKERLMSWAPLASNIEVLPLGVDPDWIPGPEDSLAQEWRKQERERLQVSGKKVLLFLGRFLPQKGLHHLIEAYRTIRGHHPDAHLLIAGGSHYGKNLPTPYVRRIRKEAQGLGEGITWLPYVRHDHVPTLLAAADLLVTPSMGSEAFGLVNLEGMAAGLPIVSTCAGGIPEVVEDGITGVLVPGKNPVNELADACISLLENPDRMRELGNHGRKRVEEHFTWNLAVKRWQDLYTRLGIK
ncbi:YheC/YheD family protein [Salinithrix halophila]|uniref:YheC/YheD family protein n=1 Tax=Salinithrix halophila TaxID=1485204 RepID=A0ABV8JKU3_9BACL